MDEISSIIQELQSIVNELRDVEYELKTKFKGIGTENFISGKLSEKTDKLEEALRKLRSIDQSQVDE